MKTLNKKLPSIIIVFLLCLTAFIGGVNLVFDKKEEITVSAAWDGTAASASWLGSGTQSAPYQIRSAEDLKKLANDVNGGQNYAGKYFIQTMSIDLNNKSWTPIGDNAAWIAIGSTDNNYFGGSYNGQLYRIMNLNIDTHRLQMNGLFGHIAGNAVLKDIQTTGNVKYVNVTANVQEGGIGGIVGAAGSDTLISGCVSTVNVDVQILAASNAASMNIGGIVGYTMGTLRNCFNIGSFSLKYVANGSWLGIQGRIGGIAGRSNGLLENSYVSGSSIYAGCAGVGTDSRGEIYLGGIVGFAGGDLSSATIKNCFGTSTLTAATSGVQINSTTYNSTASAKIQRHTSDIAGRLYKGTISNCYYRADATSVGDGWTPSANRGTTVFGISDMIKTETDASVTNIAKINSYVAISPSIGGSSNFLTVLNNWANSQATPSNYHKWKQVEDEILGIQSYPIFNVTYHEHTPGAAGGTTYSTLSATGSKGVTTCTGCGAQLSAMTTPAIDFVTAGTLTAGDQNAPYTTDIELDLTDADPSATFTFSSTTLPAGLSIAANGTGKKGVITGTPTVSGTFGNISVTATQTAGGTGSKAKTFSLTIAAPLFTAVTDITGVPATATMGTPLTLSGTVEPVGATNKTIVWSVKDAGTTGATISGATLNTVTPGIAKVTATITNGLTASTNYTKDFNITVGAASYGITYNAGGGTHSNPAEYTYGTALNLTAVSKTGYAFGGWFDNSSLTGTAVTQIPAAATGVKTFWAKLTANTYTVEYNAKGGTGEMDNSSHTYDAATALSENAFTKAGYTFMGWDTDIAAATVVHTDKKSVSNLTAVNQSTVTLYAVWKAVDYDITLYLDGGKLNNVEYPDGFNGKYNLDNIPTLPGASFVKKTGFVLLGWYRNEEYTGEAVTTFSGEEILALIAEGEADLELWVKWIAEADWFRGEYSDILSKTLQEITKDDLTDINSALSDFNTFTDEAKDALASEKELLDAMKLRAEEDVQADADAEDFKNIDPDIWDLDVDAIDESDREAIEKALRDYEALSDEAKEKLKDEKAFLDDLIARLDADQYIADNADIWNLNINEIDETDRWVIEQALRDYDNLSDEAKSKLADQKAALDAMLARLDADMYAFNHRAVLAKTAATVTAADLNYIVAALYDYSNLKEEARALLTAKKTLLDNMKTAADSDLAAITAANGFKNARADILAKIITDAAEADLAAIEAALTAHGNLTAAAKEKLTAEKEKLDAMKLIAEAKKADRLADEAAAEAADSFKESNGGIIDKSLDDVKKGDREAIEKALDDYGKLSTEEKNKLTEEKSKLDAMLEKINDMPVNLGLKSFGVISGLAILAVGIYLYFFIVKRKRGI